MNQPAKAFKARDTDIWDTLLLLGSLSLVAWGGGYLGYYSGRFDGSEFDTVPSKRSASSGPTGPPESPQFKRGRTLYADKCSVCHGGRGEGDAAKGFPPLDKSEWVTAAGTARLLRIITQAVDGPIDVAGTKYDTKGMPAWAVPPSPGEVAPLSPEELAAVATFIRGAWSNKAGAVNAGQIKLVLAESKGRDAPWKVADLEKVPDPGGGAGDELNSEQLRDKLKGLPPEKLKDILESLGK